MVKNRIQFKIKSCWWGYEPFKKGSDLGVRKRFDYPKKEGSGLSAHKNWRSKYRR